MFDPFPRKILLSQQEIRELLSMDRSTWYEFLQDPSSGFPRPVVVGKTGAGKPRHRWKKWQVLAYYEGLQHDAGQGDEPARRKS